jgi:nucleotide-binding universal stress UspA family protein
MSPAVKVSRVLVGADFDDASASALKMSGLLAAAWGAEITVLHSVIPEAPIYFTADQIDTLEAERNQSRAQTAAELRAFAAQHVPQAARVMVEEGPAADAMLRRAASFDLLVVGTHRRHGASRWWLGSVAEAVVRRSSRPVLVVPAGAVVPPTRRPLTIFSAGGGGAAEAWVEVLSGTFGGTVVRSPDIHQCAPDRLRDADLLVVSAAASSAAHAPSGAIARVLKDCVHPVLFIPAAAGTSERSVRRDS